MSERRVRKKWDPQAMAKAVEAVRNKEMGYTKASKVFGVPRGTVEKYVKSKNPNCITAPLGRKPTFPPEIEEEMVKYLLEMDHRYYGLRSKDVMRLAFDLCVKYNIKNPFNHNEKSAGRKWLRAFLRRNPVLSLRTPQGVSRARILGFTKESVNGFFDLYEETVRRFNISQHRIYNVDETGVCVVQHKHTKIISMKGKKRIGTVQSQERGGLITVVTCMNGTGLFVPPMIVFPRKNMKPELMDGTPQGSIYGCHISGWIQADLFVKWMEHFIQHTAPTPENPVLLVLDGHYSHTRNLPLIDLARENSVHIVCLPPHSSHRMQPLDVGFMAPFKTYYAQEIETWLRNNPGRVVNVYTVGKLFGNAYKKAATMQVSVNAFQKTGLIPIDRSVYNESDFIEEAIKVDQLQESPQPPITSTHPAPASSTSPSSPFPQLPSFEKATRNPRQGKAAVITASPYKAELEQKTRPITVRPKTVARNLPFTKKKKSKPDIIDSDSSSSDMIDSDSSSSNMDISLKDSSSEIEINSSDNEDTTTPASQPKDLSKLKTGTFVRVKLLYDEGKKKESTKILVGQLLNDWTPDSQMEIKFLRESGKMLGSWSFPDVDDIMTVKTDSIIDILQVKTNRRGKYTFNQ